MSKYSVSHLLSFTQEQHKAFDTFIELGFDIIISCKASCIFPEITAEFEKWRDASIDLYFIRAAISCLTANQERNFALSDKQVCSLRILLELAAKLPTWHSQLPYSAKRENKNICADFIAALDKFYQPAKKLVDNAIQTR